MHRSPVDSLYIYYLYYSRLHCANISMLLRSSHEFAMMSQPE